jgi:hypothetical protein
MSRHTSISAVEAIIDYIFNNKELLWRVLYAAGSPYGEQGGNKTMAMLVT